MARRPEEEQRPRISIAQAAGWVNPVSGDESEQVSVRKATPDDAEKIYDFLKEMRDRQARKRPDIIDREDELLSLEEVKEALSDENKLIYAAQNVNGKVVGQILCELEPNEEEGTCKLIVANIYVADESRRVSVGTSLYNEAYFEAKSRGCTGAEASCWTFDEEGIEFFRSLRFDPLLITFEKRFGGQS